MKMDFDVIIVGGGPAGLSAAVYIQRAGHTAAVIEANSCGGQMLLAHEIENYPGFARVSGMELSDAMTAQAEALGAQVIYESVATVRKTEDGFDVTTDSRTLHAYAVIVASGTEKRKLDVPGEAELIGHGVSYCAVCDGRFFRDRDVAVIGGGNTALGDALYLATFCRSVTLIHRRDTFRGDRILVDRVRKNEKIRTCLGMRPVSLDGESALSGIALVGAAPENADTHMTLPVSGVFIAAGSTPACACLRDIAGLTWDEGGYIRTDERCRTAVPGLYAAGDVRAKTLRQIATAAADGAVAGVEAAEYIDTLSR